MPRPFEPATPTAAPRDEPAPEQGLVSKGDGGAVATGALAMAQMAAGAGRVGGAS